jgi:hypothetical protein
MKTVLDMIIYKKKSMASLIQNSGAFQQWFRDSIDDMCNCPVTNARIRNLSLARQRFDSSQKPLGRAVLFFEAFVNTAVRIMNTRSGDEKLAATLFLKFIDPEVALQLAMLADGGDEALQLVRDVDRESHDPVRWYQELETFLARLLTLYGESGACLETGYTAHMLKWLGEKRKLFWVDGQAKQLDSPSADARARCLGRMQN